MIMNAKATITVVLLFFLFSNVMYSRLFQQKEAKTIQDTINSQDDYTTTYEVTEIIKMPFGTSKIFYTLSNKELIKNNDLGPNNIRIIKEVKHTKKSLSIDINNVEATNDLSTVDRVEEKAPLQKSVQSVTINLIATPEKGEQKKVPSIDAIKEKVPVQKSVQSVTINPIATPEQKVKKKSQLVMVNEKVPVQKSIQSVTINPIETYERMVAKGIQSIGILKELADFYFHKNDFVKATKYYDALFKMTTELHQDYYFRYSHSLKNTGRIKQSEELLQNHKM